MRGHDSCCWEHLQLLYSTNSIEAFLFPFLLTPLVQISVPLLWKPHLAIMHITQLSKFVFSYVFLYALFSNYILLLPNFITHSSQQSLLLSLSYARIASLLPMILIHKTWPAFLKHSLLDKLNVLEKFPSRTHIIAWAFQTGRSFTMFSFLYHVFLEFRFSFNNKTWTEKEEKLASLYTYKRVCFLDELSRKTKHPKRNIPSLCF